MTSDLELTLPNEVSKMLSLQDYPNASTLKVYGLFKYNEGHIIVMEYMCENWIGLSQYLFNNARGSITKKKILILLLCLEK